jgi:hypothetical protein
MRDVEMITTSTASVCKKDNSRNRSPGEFGGQSRVYRTKSVKIMEVEQCHVIKFFSDEGMPGLQIVARLRQHYREGTLSRAQVYCWVNEVRRARTDLNTFATTGTRLMKVLPLLLRASSMPILTFQPGSLHSSWGVQSQRFVDV